MAYFMAIELMFLNVFLMVGVGILNLFSSDVCSGSGACSDYNKGVDFPSSGGYTID